MFWCLFVITILISITWLAPGIVHLLRGQFKFSQEVGGTVTTVLMEAPMSLMLPILYVFRYTVAAARTFEAGRIFQAQAQWKLAVCTAFDR